MNGKIIHGLSKTPEYMAWTDMKGRCLNPNKRDYKHYGGRGITVCDRWMKAENFYADMGPRPSVKHSLERKDNDGPYSPDNCVWADDDTQNSNRRANRWIEHAGKRMTIQQWAVNLGVHPGTIRRRLLAGHPPERTLSTLIFSRNGEITDQRTRLWRAKAK